MTGVEDVGWDRDVADSGLALGCLGDDASRLGSHDAATDVNDGVLDVDVLAAQFGERAEPKSATVREQDHEAMPNRHVREDVSDLLGRGGPDLALAAG